MTSIVAQALIGAAQTAAQFAPVPWLGAATGVLAALVNMFAKAEANKYVYSPMIYGVSHSTKQKWDRSAPRSLP